MIRLEAATKEKSLSTDFADLSAHLRWINLWRKHKKTQKGKIRILLCIIVFIVANKYYEKFQICVICVICGLFSLCLGTTPGTRNQEPGTRNQEPETRNQEPETMNQKPGTMNHNSPLTSSSSFPLLFP